MQVSSDSDSVGIKRPHEHEHASILDGHHPHPHQKHARNMDDINARKDRWVSSNNTEDYVNTAGLLMLPDARLGQYGYKPQAGRYPFEKVNALGILMCPLRKVSVIEKWSPHEIAVFEAAITLFGKNFFRIQKYVKSKTTKEVIEFYYDWKKTDHYTEWKKSYVPDDREIPTLVDPK